MRRASIIALWVAGGLCLGLLWWRFQGSPSPQAGRAAARVVLDRLEAHVEARAARVEELAERFSAWESLPEEALGDALRSASTRQTGLGLLLVADPAGRLLAGYDPSRRLGDERLAAGSLDPVLGRREALGRGVAVLSLPSAHAGVLASLDLAAPIRRADGSSPGYVGATLDLAPLRHLLGAHRRGGLALRVATREGQLLFPCTGKAGGSGPTLTSPRFQAWVEPAAPRRGLPLTVLASLLLVAALALGTRTLTRLDRSR